MWVKIPELGNALEVLIRKKSYLIYFNTPLLFPDGKTLTGVGRISCSTIDNEFAVLDEFGNSVPFYTIPKIVNAADISIYENHNITVSITKYGVECKIKNNGKHTKSAAVTFN